MSKEFMKIGPITCSIQADPPYKVIRNGKTDFTLADEKPSLISDVMCKSLESGSVLFEAASSNFSVRTNAIGGEILNMCNGEKTIEDIAYDLAEKYDYDDDEFLEQVKTFLNIFRTYKLL
ncbi:MAG: PqqD family protein [bacterium]|nr:MAG: PqqD family protein [bacterium]